VDDNPTFLHAWRFVALNIGKGRGWRFFPRVRDPGLP
jgi:hypothetical protein